MPSYTDRLPRPGEENGGVYNFVTTAEFEQKIRENEFYEYSVHHEHYYGTSKKILNERSTKAPKNVKPFLSVRFIMKILKKER